VIILGPEVDDDVPFDLEELPAFSLLFDNMLGGATLHNNNNNNNNFVVIN